MLQWATLCICAFALLEGITGIFLQAGLLTQQVKTYFGFISVAKLLSRKAALIGTFTSDVFHQECAVILLLNSTLIGEK